MPDLESAGYEERDINPRAVAWFAIGLVVLLAIIFIAMHAFEAALSRAGRANATRTFSGRIQAPAPRLQTAPAADLAELRAAEKARLHSYGWVDRDAGFIHIPIERAIELTAQRGLPSNGAAP